LIHRLRSIPGLEELPVIILTANNPSLLQAEAFRHGAQQFLEKPVDNAVLLNTVRDTLAEPINQNYGIHSNRQFPFGPSQNCTP
jgi:CheY-like chemotaxis protein